MTFSVNFSVIADKLPEDSKQVRKIMDDLMLSNINEIPVDMEGSTKKLFVALMNSGQFQQFTNTFIREPVMEIAKQNFDYKD